MRSQKGPMIAGVFLAVILFVSIITGFFGLLHSKSLDTETNFWISRWVFWILVLIMFLYAQKVEKKPLLLWKEQKKKPLFYLLSIIIVLIVVTISSIGLSVIEKTFGVVQNDRVLKELIALVCGNKLLLVFVCLTAGVTEELIFRGYLLPRLEILFKNKWAAIIISALLFGLAHVGFGDLNRMLGPFIIGIVFAIYYSRYRSLSVLIICHFLMDFYSLYGSCK
jgi:hypothetical protein